MPTIPETATTPHTRTTGARPTGASTEAAAAQNIQQMFDAIAPTYDRANHLLSAGIDRSWWNRTARTLRPILERPEALIVDLCCGTGDMTLALQKHRPRTATDHEQRSTDNDPPILAIDFSHKMLSLALPKFIPHNILTIEADALHLPLPSNSVDLVTAAFGFRNLANYAEGLAELHRILRPGGQLAILECNQPAGLLGALYSLYFKHILPRLAALVTRNPAAYAFLPDSVERFPRPPRMIQLLTEAHFTTPTWTSYTFGTAGLYRATKP